MKRLLIIAALLAAIAATPASAQGLTSNLTTIFAGQSITFSYIIPAQDVPPFPMYIPGEETTGSGFAGAYAFLYSGDEQQLTASFGPYGGVAGTFTYLTPGNYTASINGEILYDSVVCGAAYGGCVNFPNAGGAGSGLIFGSENIAVLAAVAAVPEPATWAIMLIGFLGVGFAFHRSRRKLSFG